MGLPLFSNMLLLPPPHPLEKEPRLAQGTVYLLYKYTPAPRSLSHHYPENPRCGTISANVPRICWNLIALLENHLVSFKVWSLLCPSHVGVLKRDIRSSLNMPLLGLNILLICIPVSVGTRCPRQTLRWTNSRCISGPFTGLCQVQMLPKIPSFLHVSFKTSES